MKHYLVAALLAATIIAGGCVSDSDLPNPTGEGTVRAINAIPTSPEISFLIEERFLAAAAFKNLSASSTWDDLDYTFNFNVLLAGDSETTRIASQFIDVIADTDYTMLVSGDLEAPDITVWESAIRDWNGDETFYELRFAHASPSLGPIDAYLLDPGVAPAAGTQSATLSFTEASPIQEVEAAEKVIILTPAGDDSTILFESLPLNLIATSSYIITTFDTDANDVGSIAVTLMNTSTNSTGRLVDVDDPATGRFFHASINASDADVYLEDPLVTPRVAGHSFDDITGDLDIPTGEVPVTYTAAGNVGAILTQTDRTIVQGVRYNFYFSRNVDGEDVVTTASLDRRSIETRARISVANTAANHPVVDVYFVPPGEPIDERIPVVPSLRTQSTPIVFPLPAGDYEVYLTEPNEKNIYLGPEPLSLQLGDVAEAIIYDTVDPDTPRWFIAPPP